MIDDHDNFSGCFCRRQSKTRVTKIEIKEAFAQVLTSNSQEQRLIREIAAMMNFRQATPVLLIQCHRHDVHMREYPAADDDESLFI